MKRLNLRVLSQFWTIAKSYWLGEQKWRASGQLLVVVILSLTYTQLSVLLNKQRGELISSLSTQDVSRFWHTILIFTLVLVAYAPLFAGYVYLRDRLGLQWRKWLTHRFITDYFQNRAYYGLHHKGVDIDNPDQRIAEDVKSFTQESLTFTLAIVSSVLAVVGFGRVLWAISPLLVVFLVLYATIGTLVTVGVFGTALVRINFQQLKTEADFRFGLVRIRENAEAIAFYRGERRESDQVQNRFAAVFKNFKRLIVWELNLNVLTNAYEFLPFILPALVIAPSIFAGDLEVGKLSEAQGAFIRVFLSLNIIVSRFQSLTTFGAGIDRLHTFASYLEHSRQGSERRSPRFITSTEPRSEPQIQRQSGDQLALENLTVLTPNYQRSLIENLTVTVPTGTGLLVRGPSGCGKSSLLRAIAGLWNSGTGVVTSPPQDQILFLPQHPYMILGTLRDQMLYPNGQDFETRSAITDQDLRLILQQVNLPDLDQRMGGFDTEQDWSEVLSLGEQQRLTFARLFINMPQYVILDEATSALDRDNEANLYQRLKAMGTTFLSVGHKETLPAYHHYALDLFLDQTWQVQSLNSQSFKTQGLETETLRPSRYPSRGGSTQVRSQKRQRANPKKANVTRTTKPETSLTQADRSRD